MNLPGLCRTSQGFNSAETAKYEAEKFNSCNGDLKGYDCHICKNRGWNCVVVDSGNGRYSIAVQECGCQAVRRSLRQMSESGVDCDIRLTDFVPYEPWQKRMLLTAKNYIADHDKQWLYVGGQVGCGKTLLCSGVFVELIKKTSLQGKYMLWRDEVVKIKACVNSEQEYTALIEPLKEVPILYVDDFFKVERGKRPTAADINVAFEILNYRYNKKLATIISSELFLKDIVACDEAVGSRIYQLAKLSSIEVGKDIKKNMRLRDIAI